MSPDEMRRRERSLSGSAGAVLWVGGAVGVLLAGMCLVCGPGAVELLRMWN